MMITEHNYEEYFLLYIDNELTTAERKAIEDFVSLHPQYNAMLSALQETKLPEDDAIAFLNKNTLYKDESSDIGVNNYEEYFLLYTDNELTSEQKENTERFVLQHPQLQEEFTLLQQTKLTPEPIVYKNKKELYRKERRVVSLYYLAGLSVAAALFGVLFFTGLLSPQHQQSGTMASVIRNQVLPETKTSQKDDSIIDVALQPKKQPEEYTLAEKAIKKNSGKSNEMVQHADSKVVIEKQPAPVQPLLEDIALTHKADIQITEAAMQDNRITAKQVSAMKVLDETIEEQTSATNTMSLTDNSNLTKQAVYKELNTQDDNHTLYVSGLPINKNKVNGFLKSASRLLGGRDKQSEE